MKKTILLSAFWLCCQCIAAQQKDISKADTGIRSIDLGEVVIKSTEPDKFTNKIRSQHVFIVMNPTLPGVTDTKWDSTYFLTRFPQPEQEYISLYAVELKLKPFDTAMFDVRLMIFQIQGQDTLRKIIPINASKIDKKDKMRVVLFDENIILHPGDFYIGYGFHPKNIPELFRYRMYATSKGYGAILTFKGNGVDIVSNPHIPYVFPFKMSYRKYGQSLD